MTGCWFRETLGPTVGRCAGRTQGCHLLRGQVLCRELGLPRTARRRSASEQRTYWDPRIVVAGCEHHHWMLDKDRRLRLRAEDLPASVWEFAAEHDPGTVTGRALTAWLEREYGDA